jgi:hypothetical protein
MSRADVSRYSRVSTRFWTDEKSCEWGDRVKLAALYVMTCSHRSLEGIFKLPPQYACADLHWTLKTWKRVCTVLQESGFLKWDSRTNVLLIVNALRYQAPENPNQASAALRRINDLPETPLLQEFCALALDHCYRKGATPAAQGFAQLLQQQLHERLGQPLSPLNLKPLTQPQPITQSLTRSPRLNGEGNPDCFLQKVETDEDRKEAETMKRFPHLAQTAEFESVGQIRRKSKPRTEEADVNLDS